MAACAVSSVAQAEPRTTLSDGAVGKIEFRTYTPVSQRPLLTRSYLNEPTTVISGVLSLPTSTTLQREGKSPAVILAHGVGGVSDEREHAWAKRLNSWGIAAFVVDSYGGRGMKPPVYADSPKSTHFTAHLVDAYLALQLIATHPAIDGDRVAVMGFSKGGEVAVNAVFERFRVHRTVRQYRGARPLGKLGVGVLEREDEMRTQVGSPAVEFALEDTVGSVYRLEHYRGHWLLMVFHRHLG